MSIQLPPERDLPPYRAREIEAALVEQVVNGAKATRRRWLAPVAAAAAVVVTLGVVVGVLQGGERDEVVPAGSSAPSASPSQVSPTPSPSRSVEKPTGNMESIVPGCVASYGLGGTPEEKARVKGAKLYNLVGDASDGFALIYTEELYLYCTVGGDVMAYNAGGGPVPSMRWIPSPYRLDVQASESGRASDGSWRVEHTLAGRMSKDVTRIVVEIAGTSTEAQLSNGTFVAQVEYTKPKPAAEPTSPGQVREAQPKVRAYDAAGKELPAPDFPECIKTPDGQVIQNSDLPGDMTNCAPAVAWP
ncbi:hypothetical protein [Cryptosporangium minutisporangium]|uniref:Uncharacterized protein n=1 Tax=Cryptosporangium minutisporangium TaxID=113569 RepID=A0ABP6T396_9ACTN